MTKRQVRNRIKLIKDQLTLAQLYKEDFIKRLGGVKEYMNFINEQLEQLKLLLELNKTFDDAKDKN